MLFYHHESSWIQTYTSSDQVLTSAVHHGPPWRKKHSQNDFLSNMSPNCCSTWSRVPQFVSVTEKQAETHGSHLSASFFHLDLREEDWRRRRWCDEHMISVYRLFTDQWKQQIHLVCCGFYVWKWGSNDRESHDEQIVKPFHTNLGFLLWSIKVTWLDGLKADGGF